MHHPKRVPIKPPVFHGSRIRGSRCLRFCLPFFKARCHGVVEVGWDRGSTNRTSPLSKFNRWFTSKWWVFQDQNLLVPFSGEPTVKQNGALKVCQNNQKNTLEFCIPWNGNPGCFYTSIPGSSRYLEFRPFWRNFRVNFRHKILTQKGRSPGFSIGFFQNPVRRLQSPENEATPEKDIQSHLNWGWVFCWVCFVGVQSYEHYRTSVSVFGGWMSRGTERKNPQL